MITARSNGITVEGMMTIDRHDRNAVLAVLSATTRILHSGTHTVFAGGILGEGMCETVFRTFNWFIAQQVFNRVILVELNGHTITFEKDCEMMERLPGIDQVPQPCDVTQNELGFIKKLETIPDGAWEDMMNSK
jgi:hypothetical protein